MVMLATGAGGTGGGPNPLPDGGPETPDDLEIQPGLDLAFRALDGSELLRSARSELFVMTEGLDGIEMLAREPILEPRPGIDGAVLKELKIGVRRAMVPILIWSEDSLGEYLELRDRLASFAQHRRTTLRFTDGVFDLVATSARGTRTLRVTYLDGWPGTYSPDTTGIQFGRRRFMRCAFDLLAAQPYWQGAYWTTPVIGGFTSAAWFGDWPGELAPSFTIGQAIGVRVGGDGPSYAKARIRGPFTNLQVDGGNFHLSIPGGLLAGEVFDMESDPRRPVMLINGVSAWDRVGPCPRLEPMLPGTTDWTISSAGMTSASSVQVYGINQHERPW